MATTRRVDNGGMVPATPSKPRRLLLLSVSAGAGHVRAAQALQAAALARGDVQVEHLDVLTVVSPAFRKVYGELYMGLIERHPAVWAQMYQRSDRVEDHAWAARLRRALERLSTRGLQAAVAAAQPDVVICTHFLPADLLARAAARGHMVPPVWVQVTDFDVHGLWLQPSSHHASHGAAGHQPIRGYCVANDEVAFRVQEALPGMAVAVTGIPIMPVFAAPLDRHACAQALGLDPRLPTALVMTGGAGMSSGVAMVERLLRVPGAFQIVAIAGRNEALLLRYQQLAQAHPGKLWPLGFTTTIERVMAACDLVVTKPGGLTTSECLALGLPMLLISPIPGQEERNAQHLLEQGAAWLAMDATALEFRWRVWLAQPQRLNAMRERARALGMPLAAANVLEHVLG
jgi:processive 1,2-diacylglycerol beta-glucosyltransferase